MSHEHYFIDVSHIDRLDVYRLLDLFKVTCPVAQHIVKKALAAGQRGHKDTRRDWQDIADSAARRLQMIDEDIAITERLTDALGGKAAFGQQNTLDYRADAEKAETQNVHGGLEKVEIAPEVLDELTRNFAVNRFRP